MPREDGSKVVHILKHGQPMCGFSREVPRDWPCGHYWVSFNSQPRHLSRATCEGCGSALKDESKLPKD